jgi:hypothetical protein
MTQKEQAKNAIKQQKLVDDFNAKYNPGDPCKLKKDGGEIQDVTVRAPATLMGGHTAMGWFKEISRAYMLERVVN